MRTFEHFPKDTTCPICKTSDNKACVLIRKEGGEILDEGRTVEAQPFHLDCIDLKYAKDYRELDHRYRICSLIYQSFNYEKCEK